MKIGVVACGGATVFMQRLMASLEEMSPGSATLFDWSHQQARFTLSADLLDCNGLDLTHMDRVLVHGFTYVNPVIPKDGGDREWGVWQIGHLGQQQEFSTHFSLLREMERRGVSVWNPLGLHLDQFMKFAWLERMRLAGFQVPAMVCLNDPESAVRFMQTKDKVVWRPGMGRAGWQLFGKKQLENRVGRSRLPVLLAEVISGPLTRGFIFGHKLRFGMQFQSPEFTPPLESLERVWEVNVEPWQAVLNAMAQKIGLAWGMVTFVDGEGGPWIYDVDPDPDLEWLPTLWQELLVSVLASALINRDMGDLLAKGEGFGVLERQNLFLRRMMAPLFEMESRKNAP